MSNTLVHTLPHQAGWWPESRDTRYKPPEHNVILLSEALEGTDRSLTLQHQGKQPDMFDVQEQPENQRLYFAGNISLLHGRCVAIIGARKVSDAGKNQTARFAKFLAQNGVVVVSGLAEGVDTAALKAAIDAGGRVVAVIGTPLDRAYPAKNKRLQEEIYRNHLLISQFPPGSKVYKSNFPQRNRLMAFISNATIVMEASNTSGTLHQAVECQRRERRLFIYRGVFNDPAVDWPERFLINDAAQVVDDPREIVAELGRHA